MSGYLKEIDGEVAQNDVYAGILKKSLDYGPELLLHLHDSISEEEISDQPAIVAIQKKVDSSDKMELDWVIDGGNRWIGFESKKGDTLKPESQLAPELEDLRTHSDKDPILVAITDDIRKPIEKIEKAESEVVESGQVRWESWHSIARRVYDTNPDELPEEQRPFADILQDMFESGNYSPKFDGIESTGTTHDRIKRREKNLISLTDTVTAELPEEPYWNKPHPVSYTHNAVSRAKNKKREKMNSTFRHLSPQYVSFQYIESKCDTQPSKQSSVSLLTNLHQDEYYTVLDVNIKRESDELDVEYLMERSDELKDVCESTDLNLWISTNSWDVEGYPQEGSLEDIERLIEQAQEAASHKRLMFGHRVGYQDFDSPERFVGGIVDNLRELTEVFLLDNSFFDEAFPHVE